MAEKQLLSIRDLSLQFEVNARTAFAIRGLSLDIKSGETVGVVGESGSGKSVLCYAILNLIAQNGEITNGEVIFDEENILQKSEKELSKFRGKRISMIFQDPLAHLNPSINIGNQIMWIICQHSRKSRKEARARVLELLKLVGIRDREHAMRCYPHQFSGGQRQRILIAMALSCNPDLLLADEPTTALDVTIQAQVLNLIEDLNQKDKMAVLLVTHDFGVAARLCDKIVVMYGGMIMEQASAQELFLGSKNPYTKALLSCIPSLETKADQTISQIDGEPPDIFNLTDSCPFHERCKHTMNICTRKLPPSVEITETHMSSCWLLDPRAPHVPGFELDKEEM